MSRSEQPVPDGPLREFAEGLRALRRAEKLTYRHLSERANYSYSVLSTAAAGRVLPTLEVTLAYVKACKGDVREWEERWKAVSAALRAADKGLPSPEARGPALEESCTPAVLDVGAHAERRHTVRCARLASAAVVSVAAVAATAAAYDGVVDHVHGVAGKQHTGCTAHFAVAAVAVAGSTGPATSPGNAPTGIEPTARRHHVDAADTATEWMTGAAPSPTPSSVPTASAGASPGRPTQMVSAPATVVRIRRPGDPLDQILSGLTRGTPHAEGDIQRDGAIQ